MGDWAQIKVDIIMALPSNRVARRFLLDVPISRPSLQFDTLAFCLKLPGLSFNTSHLFHAFFLISASLLNRPNRLPKVLLFLSTVENIVEHLCRWHSKLEAIRQRVNVMITISISTMLFLLGLLLLTQVSPDCVCPSGTLLKESKKETITHTQHNHAAEL
ncbi:unnamed protein product [Protopolystoma xenopodis]|uniref:Uncharacterized protein n=1 Tax=Protopolystoma xenopodis TaxID=117903 RepID=A0A448WXL3_9PLAT|nr:unnamed protein product [Protopolystoma xenopodis]